MDCLIMAIELIGACILAMPLLYLFDKFIAIPYVGVSIFKGFDDEEEEDYED